MIRKIKQYSNVNGVLKTVYINIPFEDLSEDDESINCYFKFCKYCTSQTGNYIESCISNEEKIIKDLLE